MNASDFLARARTAIRIGDTALAERLLTQVLEAKPRMAPAHNLLGLVYDRTGSHLRAVEHFRQAIELRKNYAEAHNNLGVTLRKLERYDEAISAFASALKFSRNRGDVHYNLGNVFKSLGRTDQAIEQFTRAIAVAPAFAPAYNNLGTVYEQLGRLEEAVSVYRRGLEIDANQPHLHYNLGIVLQRTGGLKEAQAEFQQALRFRPGWPEAMNNLGVVYQRLGQHRQAIRVLQELLKIQPDNLQARNNLGVVHSEIGAPDQALRYYRDALRLEPGYGPAASNLGNLFEKHGPSSGALEEFERLADLDPGNLEARYRLATAYLDFERFDEAAALLKQNLTGQPDHLPSLRALARYHQQRGQGPQAENLYRRLLELDPGNPGYLLDIAQGAWQRGDLERAEGELKRYLERVPDDLRVRLRLGELYLQRSNLRHALTLFKEILEGQPDNLEALGLLARAYRQMGEPHHALETLEHAVSLQGGAGAGQDMNRLRETLDMYEETVSEYGEPHREQWARNLERLGQVGRRTSPEAAPAPELTPPVAFPDEEEVPIINFGGREPVLAVSESEERIDLDAVEETDTLQPEPVDAVAEAAGLRGEGMTVSLRDETPMSLISMLEGQSLYEENPNWRDYQPPSFAQEAGPGPTAGLSGEAPAGLPGRPAVGAFAGGPPEAEHLLSSPMFVRRAGAPTEPTTGPAVRLVPPETPLAPPAAAAPPAGREGAALGALSDMVRAQGEMISRLQSELRELPQRLRPADSPVGAWAPPSQPADAPLPEPTAQEIMGEEIPKDPGEGEHQGGGEEEHLRSLRERLRGFLRRIRERLEQKPAEEGLDSDGLAGPEPLLGSEHHPQPALRTGHPPGLDSEPPAKPAPPREASDQSGLRGYLEELAEHLPERERTGFLRSDARLKIEYAKTKLQGKPGIRRRIEKSFVPASPAELEASGGREELSLDKITDTFAFIAKLAAYHPDRTVGTILQSKVRGVLQKMRE